MGIILQAKDICKYYGAGENQVRAVDHASLAIEMAVTICLNRKRKGE